MKGQRRNDILIKNIGVRLKAIRVERGLTQETVHSGTDLNIGRIEGGKHSITITTLSDLCDYYGITLDELFKEKESK